MKTNHAKLRELAEAVLAMRKEHHTHHHQWLKYNQTLRDFTLATDPQTIIGLLDELDKLTRCLNPEGKEYLSAAEQWKLCIDELEELQYRHECLKMLYTDEMNYKSDETVNADIDGFINEEQSHS